MANNFECEIILPGRELVVTEVTEVVLPAHDGEVGVLASHGDFVGVLGIGALKYVSEGKDYWVLVGPGVFEVQSGRLTVLTELAEEADEIDFAAAQAQLKDLEKAFTQTSRHDSAYEHTFRDYALAKARLEVHRRTSVVH